MPKGLRKLDLRTEVYSNGPVLNVQVYDEELDFDFDEMVDVVRKSPRSGW
ncbi:MAG: hypothetical protein ACT4OD_03205 [Candidatus Nitrosotenuis sp.]